MSKRTPEDKIESNSKKPAIDIDDANICFIQDLLLSVLKGNEKPNRECSIRINDDNLYNYLKQLFGTNSEYFEFVDKNNKIFKKERRGGGDIHNIHEYVKGVAYGDKMNTILLDRNDNIIGDTAIKIQVEDKVLSSVGKMINADGNQVGTGWVVELDGSTLVITTRDVASNNPTTIDFGCRVNSNGSPLDSDHPVFKLGELVWTSVKDNNNATNVAFYELGASTNGRAAPPPLKFNYDDDDEDGDEGSKDKKMIIVVGYPRPDKYDDNLKQRYFGGPAKGCKKVCIGEREVSGCQIKVVGNNNKNVFIAHSAPTSTQICGGPILQVVKGTVRIVGMQIAPAGVLELYLPSKVREFNDNIGLSAHQIRYIWDNKKDLNNPWTAQIEISKNKRLKLKQVLKNLITDFGGVIGGGDGDDAIKCRFSNKDNCRSEPRRVKVLTFFNGYCGCWPNKCDCGKDGELIFSKFEMCEYHHNISAMRCPKLEWVGSDEDKKSFNPPKDLIKIPTSGKPCIMNHIKVNDWVEQVE